MLGPSDVWMGNEMGELKSAPVAELASKNRITAEDVVMLRREVFGDGVVTRGEAEALFALDAIRRGQMRGMAGFFHRGASPTTSFIRKSRRAISRRTMPTGWSERFRATAWSTA